MVDHEAIHHTSDVFNQGHNIKVEVRDTILHCNTDNEVNEVNSVIKEVLVSFLLLLKTS